MTRARLAIAWTAILALAVSLRFVALSRESYWLDELATLDVIGESWSRFAAVLARFDNHPPLYFAHAKAWAAIFGTSEVALRSLSAGLGVASVVAAGALAREWSKARSEVAAMAAAVFIAVLPISVRHAREARMYSLLELTTLLALLSLTRVLDDRPPRRIALALAAHTALLYTHVYGAFVVAGEIAFVGVRIVVARFGGLRGRGGAETELRPDGGAEPAGIAGSNRGAERADTRRGEGVEHPRVALATLVASVVAFTPWLPVLRSRTATVGERFWIGSPGWTWPFEWAGGHFIGATFVTALALAAAIAVVRAFGASGGRSSVRSVTLSIVTVGSLTALPIALALVYRPIFVPKYAIGAAAALCVLASLGVATMKSPRSVAALVVIAGLGLASTVTKVLQPRLNEDWRAIAQLASRACSDRSATVAAARYAPMYRHYLPANCTVVDLEPLVRAPGDPERAAIRDRLAATNDILLLEVHPPRTDARVESVLAEMHSRAGVTVANDARATRWVRTAH